MNPTRRSSFLSIFLCGQMLCANDNASKPKDPAASQVTEQKTFALQMTARSVAYGERDVIPVRTRLRFTTMIILPRHEQILDFVCGDKEFWIVNGAQNFAYVKPAKVGARTSLNLVTASGNVYSFVLTETDADPDLKLFVEPRDEAMVSAIAGAPRFVPVQQVEDYRQQVEIAKAETRETKRAAAAQIEQQIGEFRNSYPGSMKFEYRFAQNQRPFSVTSIFHDGKFTYIQASPQEVPAVYEVKDGKPNLIQFQFRNGTYVIDKVLDSGYLSIGKERLPFYRTQH
jgi:type IV secretory pathway VirB9-like protein